MVPFAPSTTTCWSCRLRSSRRVSAALGGIGGGSSAKRTRLADKRADANAREAHESIQRRLDSKSAVSERVEAPFLLRPVGLHLHPQLEVHARLEQRLER